jgi:hypothetical protein
MNILFPSLMSLVFVAIGAAVLSYARRTAEKARQSASWPTTAGEIAHSAMLYQTDRTAGTGNTAAYRADVSYRYKVNGANYSSSQITLADFSSTRTRAQGIVERYPDKSTVEVYYNPANPSESVLEPGSTGGITLVYLFGAGFAAGGLFFLVMSLTGHVHTSTHIGN